MWPAKANADHWATLVIDLLQLQRDFDTLFSKHWLTPIDLGESARFMQSRRNAELQAQKRDNDRLVLRVEGQQLAVDHTAASESPGNTTSI